MQDFINRVNPKKTQIISLIKSGAIPCKDKKKALMKYLMSTYTKGSFKPVTSVPSPYSKLEAFGLNVDDYLNVVSVTKE